MKLNHLILTTVLLKPLAAQAGEYYLSSSHGDDANSGRSPDQPWQSLDRANSTRFGPGDVLYLEAGSVFKGQLALQGGGAVTNGVMVPAKVDSYGKGKRPRIDGAGKVGAAVLLHNVEGWEIRRLEITNTGADRQQGRSGIHVLNETLPVARHIVLDGLFVHDVNGSLPKHQLAGAAIRIQASQEIATTRFHELRVENCRIKDCSRNGIIINGGPLREKWNPSTAVVVRQNLIEGVGGDGIVPACCDGALIEWNTMRDCPRYGEEGGAAAGIWPWSSDNTILQFNEVSGHKAWIDAQAYDCDYNCNNTLYQYNYSHDNEGGFMLLCSPGIKTEGWLVANAWNRNSVVRYNLSIDDGSRKTSGHVPNFAPVFSLTGETTVGSRIYRNLIVLSAKLGQRLDPDLIHFGEWGGKHPVDTIFRENVFWLAARHKGTFSFGSAKCLAFEKNDFYGPVAEIPSRGEITAQDNRFQKRTPQTVTIRGPKQELQTFADFLKKKGNPQEQRGIRIHWEPTAQPPTKTNK